MLEKFQFFSLLIANYLVLGMLIVILTRGLLCLITANATTRHNVWFSVLVLLLFLPLQSFITPHFQANILNAKLESNSNEFLTEIISPPVRSIDNAERLGPLAADQSDPISAGEANPPSTQWQAPLWRISLEFFSNSKALSWIGISLSLLLLTGAIFRIITTIQSYQDLRRLVASSEPVSGELYSRLTKLGTYIRLNRAPRLKHSSQVRNPLATGIFHPTILMPSHMTRPDVSNVLLDQVLLHELAHIKRRDTIIVLIQAVASIFLYWHPAVRYINRKISFERELACDDWVVNYDSQNRAELAGSYATNLVELSKSLRHNSLNLHSLAWLQSTDLKARVRILLDSNLDHSTGTYARFCLLMLCLMLVLPSAWAPVWPQYPFPSQAIAESIVTEEQKLHLEVNPTFSSAAEPNVVELSGSGVPEVSEEQSAFIDIVRAEPTIKPISEYQRSNRFATGVEPLQIQISPRDSSGRVLAADLEPIQLVREIKQQAPETGQEYFPSGPHQLSAESETSNQLPIPAESAEPGKSRQLRLNIDETGELTISAPTTVEEITVTARRSLYSLRSEIRRTKRMLYLTYNEHNQVKEFQVHCRKKELYEDLLRAYRCWPQFFEDVVAADAQAVINGAGMVRAVYGGQSMNLQGITPIATLKARNRSRFESLKNNILVIAMEQPDVYDSLTKLAQLEQVYHSRREECLAKPPVLFVFRRCS